MNRYQWCGLTIASSVALPELPASDDTRADPAWTVTRRPGRAPERPGRQWFHEWHLAEGRPWAAFARDPRGYLIRFVEIGDYDVDLETRTIECWDPGDAPSHTVRHMLLDQVLPLLAATPERLAVHASVVDTPQGAIAIVATSGHGKSSLAARFAQKGYAILSDDCCIIEKRGEEFVIVPSYPGLRLRPDSIVEALDSGVDGAEPVAHYSTKLRMTIAKGVKYHSTPVRLDRIYVIRPLEELRQATQILIAPQGWRQSLVELFGYAFHLDVGNQARLRAAFVLAGEIVERYPLRHLTFPWNWKQIDRVVDRILADAS